MWPCGGPRSAARRTPPAPSRRCAGAFGTGACGGRVWLCGGTCSAAKRSLQAVPHTCAGPLGAGGRAGCKRQDRSAVGRLHLRWHLHLLGAGRAWPCRCGGSTDRPWMQRRLAGGAACGRQGCSSGMRMALQRARWALPLHRAAGCRAAARWHATGGCRRSPPTPQASLDCRCSCAGPGAVAD